MDHDVREADRLLIRLSEVLRATFGGMATDEVALEEEMGFALLYLGIERTCAGAVELRTTIAPPALGALVPHMAVFPLIEQAWRQAGESSVVGPGWRCPRAGPGNPCTWRSATRGAPPPPSGAPVPGGRTCGSSTPCWSSASGRATAGAWRTSPRAG